MKDIQYNIKIRPTAVEDLETLFHFQLDDEANHLAAFTSKDSRNKEAYIAKFTKLLADPTVNNQTIMAGTVIAGSIAKFIMEGDAEITYWIDKNFRGKGVATTALENFLVLKTTRPIFGWVAFDNPGSQKVLEKCGFIKIGTDKGFANARQMEIEEFIYRLDH